MLCLDVLSEGFGEYASLVVWVLGCGSCTVLRCPQYVGVVGVDGILSGQLEFLPWMGTPS